MALQQYRSFLLAATQQVVARRLGVSQAYVSMLQRGRRPLTGHVARKLVRAGLLPPTVLPLPVQLRTGQTISGELARDVAALGYPGFSHLRSRRSYKNPAEVLLLVLAQLEVEARIIEALPWLLLRFESLPVDGLARHARLLDLQNRLGFLVSMAELVAAARGSRAPSQLAYLRNQMERSRLAKEDTLCQASLTPRELEHLRKHRSDVARHWNLLTGWRPEHFRYA